MWGMGLRHVTVVDSSGRLSGIVTRKDMQPDRLDGAVARPFGARDSLYLC